MAIVSGLPFAALLFAALFSLSLTTCSSFNPKLFYNASEASGSGWADAKATFYGAPNGAGTEGGACGYKDAVSGMQFKSMVTAISDNVYQQGSGCGLCYQVKCEASANPSCSGIAARVTVTDECPGKCNGETSGVHFDLSGTALGTLAKKGSEDALRNAGVVQIQYQSVPCNYPDTKVTFKMDSGSNNYVPAMLIEYLDGVASIKTATLVDSIGTSYIMKPSWGAVWKVDTNGKGVKPPLTITVVEVSGAQYTAKDVIPANYETNKAYTAAGNFNV